MSSRRRLLAAVVTVVLLGGAFASHQAARPADGSSGSVDAAAVGSPLLPFPATSTAPAGPPSTRSPGPGPDGPGPATRENAATSAPEAELTTRSDTGPGPTPDSPTGTSSRGRPAVPTAEVQRVTIPGVLSAPFGGTVSPDPDTNMLEPAGVGAVYRWAERGRPGTDASDTVYLLGHTVRAGGGVFDDLQRVRVGQRIRLTTRTGTLDYMVTATRLYQRNHIQHADEVYAAVPGRLVLVGCYLNPDGSRQDRNFVVFAQLVR